MHEYSFVQSSDVNWNAGWHVVNADTTINGRVTVTGNVNLILCDGKTLTVPKGITVSSGNSLTVWAQSTGTNMGQLYVGTENGTKSKCEYGDAGIGGSGYNASGAITINGGTIYAAGGDNGAGIGTCAWGNGSTITIRGGTVNAIGGGNAAAIGAGASGYIDSTIISGNLTVVNRALLRIVDCVCNVEAPYPSLRGYFSTGMPRPHRRGPTGPFSLKNIHWIFFRAFEPLKTAHCAVFRALDATAVGKHMYTNGLFPRKPSL